MLFSSEEIRQYLERLGVIRDDSHPYGYVGYQGVDGGFLVIDESYPEQDIEFLIEDAEVGNADYIAAILKKLLKAKEK